MRPTHGAEQRRRKPAGHRDLDRQLGIEPAFEAEQDVALHAPVVGQVSRAVVDHPDADRTELARAPMRRAGFARVFGGGDRCPVGGAEGPVAHEVARHRAAAGGARRPRDEQSRPGGAGAHRRSGRSRAHGEAAVPVGGAEHRARRVEREHAPVVRRARHVARRHGGEPGLHRVDALDRRATCRARRTTEIGRASCRERVSFLV
mgnify:CR=1 FL=1